MAGNLIEISKYIQLINQCLIKKILTVYMKPIISNEIKEGRYNVINGNPSKTLTVTFPIQMVDYSCFAGTCNSSLKLVFTMINYASFLRVEERL